MLIVAKTTTLKFMRIITVIKMMSKVTTIIIILTPGGGLVGTNDGRVGNHELF